MEELSGYLLENLGLARKSFRGICKISQFKTSNGNDFEECTTEHTAKEMKIVGTWMPEMKGNKSYYLIEV